MNSWLHLGQGLLLGGGLGLLYGFLRFFRPRWLGDLLFVIVLFQTWLYLGFGLCRGDLRMGYTIALCSGAFLWECTFGIWLRPLFSSFWYLFFRCLSKISRSLKNIIKKSEISEIFSLQDGKFGLQ